MDIRASLELENLRSGTNKKSFQKIKKSSSSDIACAYVEVRHERKKWLKDNVASKEFILVDIPVCSVATINASIPERVSMKATLDENPIVVDVNKNNAGRTSGGFIPKVLIIHGAGQHEAARRKGVSHIKAWVGAEAAKILRVYADHQFGSQELQEKISECLREKFKKGTNGKSDVPLSPYPWIKEVYPFEDYFIYQYDGDLFRQKYTCDVKKRTVTFDGEPTEVVQKYIDLGGNGTNMESTIQKFSEVSKVQPNGNQPGKTNGFLYNKSAPGTGVGPRVVMPPPKRSELGGRK